MIFGLSLNSVLRWRIFLPGLIIAVALAAGAWFVVHPTYQRTATLLLVPGRGSVPDDGNPYFYLAGLTQAADVVVHAVGSENVRHDVAQDYPGATYTVTRDPTTAGPVIMIVVEAPNDAEAAAVVGFLIERAGNELRDIQAADKVLPSYRIKLRPVTIDDYGTVRDRTRLVAAAGAGIFGAAGVVLIAVIVALRARRRELANVSPDAGGGKEAAEVAAGSERTAADAVDSSDMPTGSAPLGAAGSVANSSEPLAGGDGLLEAGDGSDVQKADGLAEDAPQQRTG